MPGKEQVKTDPLIDERPFSFVSGTDLAIVIVLIGQIEHDGHTFPESSFAINDSRYTPVLK